MKKVNVAVVGVGAVGVEMLRCLKQRKFPVDTLRVLARSERDIVVDGDTYHVMPVSEEAFDGIDIALFAGTEGEKGAAVTYASVAVSKGAVVIDNGADFRLRDDVPLVVPEANRDTVREHNGIIANPNCTTIQMIVALNQVHKRFGLEQIILSSYQAVSGAGKQACVELFDEVKALAEANEDKGYDDAVKKLKRDFDVFGEQIAFNLIPKIGGFADQGYTSEEWKVVHETRKIYGDSGIKATATCVRVPVFGAHSETIYFTTRKDTTIEQIKQALLESEGVVFHDDGDALAMPLHVETLDPVHVGRLRQDPFNKNCYWLWAVADNLRKGAALNAVQIAEEVVKLK